VSRTRAFWRRSPSEPGPSEETQPGRVSHVYRPTRFSGSDETSSPTRQMLYAHLCRRSVRFQLPVPGWEEVTPAGFAHPAPGFPMQLRQTPGYLSKPTKELHRARSILSVPAVPYSPDLFLREQLASREQPAQTGKAKIPSANERRGSEAP